MTVRPAHVLLLLAPLVGCMKPDRASLEMVAICFPPAADSCAFSSTCSAQVLGNQTVDVDMTGSLFLPVQVNNQMLNNADDASGHVNTHDALVQQVSVSYSVEGISVGSVTNDLQQSVPAAGSSVLGLELLDSASHAAFVAGIAAGGSVQVIADVKLKGILTDGSAFETGAYRVPINVCRGCLVAAYVCADPKQIVTAVCPHAGQSPATVACGSGPTFTLGGVVTGLTATDLIVRCNGTDIPVSGSSWTSDAITDGSSYVCTITQPSTQSCTFVDPSRASGTLNGANVIDIDVTCS